MKPILVVVAAGCLLLGALFLTQGVEAAWRWWNIPTMTPAFADLRSITGGADSYRAGYDPLIQNPGDPWGRPMNYPRIWQGLFWLGIDQGDTVPLGVGMALALLVGVLLVAWYADWPLALLWGTALFSPSVLLGVERGNSDLLMFFLLALGLWLAPRRRWFALAAILAGFVLKLFPIFGLALFLREPVVRLLRLLAIAVLVVLGYLALSWSDLVQIQGATPKDWWFSFGRECFGIWLGQVVDAGKGWPPVAPWVILGLAVAALWFDRVAPWRSPAEGYALDAFRLGAAVFLGAFLLGTNYNYRLAFLLFALPQLLAWGREGAGGRRLLAWTMLAALLFSLWSPVGEPLLPGLQLWRDLYVVADELANWALFGGMLLLFVHALPAWMKFWRGARFGLPDPG